MDLHAAFMRPKGMTSSKAPEQDLPEIVTRGTTLSVTGISIAEFRSTFRRLRGDGYIPHTTLMTARQRIIAVVGQAQGDVVVAGMAALIMHGSEWYDEDFTIELIRRPNCSGRPAKGTVTHRLDLAPADVVIIDGIKVTSVIRTAFDIGRIRFASRALGYLDALANATGFDVAELERYTASQKRRRNVVQLRRLIPLVDGRIESPAEAWLLLTMIEGGLPAPDIQIEVRDRSGVVYARIDMGYEALKIGIEYDGEYHTRPGQQVRDADRHRRLDDDGWLMIYVDKVKLRENPYAVVAEIRQALHRRGAYFD